MFDRLFSRRLCATLAAFLLTGAVLAVADPAWARAIGLDVWNMPALQEEVRNEAVLDEQLGATSEHILRRIEVKESLVNDLIAGRSTLAEVTAQFREMDAAQPTNLSVIRSIYPGDTDEEKMARNVISYSLPRVAPEKRAALQRRLEAELQQMIAGSASR